jgi:hypothetical protein
LLLTFVVVVVGGGGGGGGGGVVVVGVVGDHRCQLATIVDDSLTSMNCCYVLAYCVFDFHRPSLMYYTHSHQMLRCTLPVNLRKNRQKLALKCTTKTSVPFLFFCFLFRVWCMYVCVLLYVRKKIKKIMIYFNYIN